MYDRGFPRGVPPLIPRPADLDDPQRLRVLEGLYDLAREPALAARVSGLLGHLLALVGATAGAIHLRVGGTTHTARIPDATVCPPLDALLVRLDGQCAQSSDRELVVALGEVAGRGAFYATLERRPTTVPPAALLLARLAGPWLTHDVAPDDAAVLPAAPRSREQLKHAYPQIRGESPALLEVLATLDKICDSEIPVLIRGESGTGKELVARAIHENGPRRGKPYVSENCAALTETLLESELFGHVKGAFTGAVANKPGLFDQADGGTLFLDEVGDMSLGLQKKVLRALQDGEIRPVGGKARKHGDVRIVSATNRPLEQMITDGRFREDLYYRLNVVKLRLPPLRERAGDIPFLIEHFVAKACKQYGLPPKRIAPEAMAMLAAHTWPGNIRELENEVSRMVLMGDDPIAPAALSDAIRMASRSRA